MKTKTAANFFIQLIKPLRNLPFQDLYKILENRNKIQPLFKFEATVNIIAIILNKMLESKCYKLSASLYIVTKFNSFYRLSYFNI